MKKNKITTGLLAFMMIAGMFAGISYNTRNEISAATNPSNAPTGWAFTAESVQLHDAILAAYDADFGGTGDIDSDNDGYISIPEAEAYTNSIKTLNLTNKNISGTLNGIEYFKKMDAIYLGGNQLSGSIPSNIGNLTTLKHLRLNNNQLSGSIPASLGSITGLTQLWLGTNDLSGDIPSELGALTSLQYLYLGQNPQLTGTIPTGLKNAPGLFALQYYYTGITTTDLTGFNALTYLVITKSTNANLSNLTSLYVSGSKTEDNNVIRLTGSAGAFQWNAATGYYVINAGMGAKYDLLFLYEVNGASAMTACDEIILSQGALMDDEGNLIIGASLADVDTSTGAITLPSGGVIVSGEATYTFDETTVINNGTITTEGKTSVNKHEPDFNQINGAGKVTVNTIDTEIITPEGSEATINLDNSGATITVPEGSEVIDNDGDKTYVIGGGSVDTQGDVLSNDRTITVPSDKIADVTTDGSEVTFPAGVTVDDGNTSITYPGNIIYDTDDNTIKYLPVDGLFNEDGTLKDGITQEDITNSKDFVSNLDDSALKTELQDKVNEAQKDLDERNAQKAVDDLFDKDGNIKDTVTQDDIDNAQDLVDKVTDADKKAELQDKLNEAQKQLDEKNFVILEAFKIFTGKGTVYTKIDAPVEKFNKLYIDGKELEVSNYEVTSGSTVITLNEAYLKSLANGTYDVDVEFSSGAVVETKLTVNVSNNPSTKPTDPSQPPVDVPTVSKPSIDANGSSTKNGNSVDTGDTTDMALLYGMLAISLLGIVVVSKRKKVN